MHTGLDADASRGADHGAGWLGGEKRSGGEAANGIPRYLLTAAIAEGSRVVVPTTAPEPIVTVGRVAESQKTALERKTPVIKRDASEIRILTDESILKDQKLESTHRSKSQASLARYICY